MSSKSVLTAAHKRLTDITEAYLEALDGIPDDDLANWKPTAASQDVGEMNTFSGMSMHTVSVARFIWEHQIFGNDIPRDRTREWTAKLTNAEITEAFDNMLRRLGELIEEQPEVDLEAPATTPLAFAHDWNKMIWLIESVDHTSTHLGHAQIHKQLWLAERGESA